MQLRILVRNATRVKHERAGARCPRCRSRHVTTMHRRDKSGMPEISLALLLRPNGDLYSSLSLSLPLLFLSIFLSPVEGEFLIGIDILVARAVIIEMRNGRNFPACLLLNHTDEACLPIFGQTRLAILASRNVHKRRFFLLFMFKVF